MKAFGIVLLMVLAGSVLADVQVKFAGGAVDNASIGNNRIWSNPNLATGGTNATYATVIVDGEISHYLYLTNYAFTIPPNATIDGVVVTPMRRSSSTANGGSRDSALRLITNSIIGTVDRATATIYTVTDTTENHGSSTDTWGVVLSPVTINSPTFGTAFAVTKPSSVSSAHTISVDFVRITVYYSLPSSSRYRRFAKPQFVY